MRIPSYDDLTPSIPDIAPGEVFASVGTLLPESGPIAARLPQPAAGPHPRRLYAALHGAASAAAPDAIRGRAARDGHGPQRALAASPDAQASAIAGCPPAGADADLPAIARDFSPRVERYPGGTVVLDVAGLERLFGDAPAIARQLARAGAPHVAIAGSWTSAILLARARPGITVAPCDPEAALRDVPMPVLQQLLDGGGALPPPAPARAAGRASPNATGRTFDVLRRWGLTTLGELAALPAADLSARLGAHGLAAQRLARGIDPRPLAPDPAVPRFLDSFELEWPVDALEPLSFVFARLLDPLAAALERADRGAVALHLRLRLTDRTAHARSLQLPAPMRDPKVLRTLLLLDLESHPPSAAVDAVSIELDPAPGRVVQFSLLQRAVPSPETLVTLMARLGALVGDSRCGSPVLPDTHRPDGLVMAFPAFADTSAVAMPAAPAAQDALPLTLRRFRPPVAVRVTVEGGRPARVAIDRRGMPGGSVRQCAGPWRTSGGWWERDRWNRDEWDAALSDGTVCRLFHDRDSGAWFVEAVVD